MKSNIPDFAVGDTVCVRLRIVEQGGKERLQMFTGTVIARTGSGLSETFSVHRVAYGEGMERVFFLHSPLISSIELVRRGKVRRSKLYYLRGTSGKKSKVKGRFMGDQAPALGVEQENQVEQAEPSLENARDVTA